MGFRGASWHVPPVSLGRHALRERRPTWLPAQTRRVGCAYKVHVCVCVRARASVGGGGKWPISLRADGPPALAADGQPRPIMVGRGRRHHLHRDRPSLSRVSSDGRGSTWRQDKVRGVDRRLGSWPGGLGPGPVHPGHGLLRNRRCHLMGPGPAGWAICPRKTPARCQCSDIVPRLGQAADS